MDDSLIKNLLFQRKEEGLQEASRKYARLYLSVIGEILDDSADIEECANDVLLSLWNSIPPADPDNLSAYIGKIARRIAIDRLRYNHRQKRNRDYQMSLAELEECLTDESDSSSALLRQEELSRVLSDFIRGLDPETRVLFVRRYVYTESVSSLAKRFQMKEGTVSVRLLRARKKLKTFLEKEGIHI